MEAAIGELVQVASETDPDRVVFGPAMTKKVLALRDRFESARPGIVDACQRIVDAFEPIRCGREQRKAAEEAARQQAALIEEQERLAREEADRVVQREREAAEEKERLRKEDEERAAHAVERRRYEAERGVREVIKAREADRAAVLAERLERSKTMPLALVLNIVEEGNTPSVYCQCLRALSDIVDNIVANPEDPKFRHVRKANEKLGSRSPARRCDRFPTFPL